MEKTPYALGWSDDLGPGPAYQFHLPDGHLTGIYVETEKYRSGPKDQSALKNPVSQFPARGINARRIDQFTLFAANNRGVTG